MVSLSDIHLNNTSLLSPGTGPTAAFLGATAGIGLATVRALLRNTSTPTIYLVGRNSTRLNSLITTILQPLNPSAKIHPIVTGDLTLVKSAHSAALEILSKNETGRIDILVMSPGFLSFNTTPDFSPEGLDRITAVRYHARMRFLLALLPQLRNAPNPRVLSILAGGQEGPLILDDLGMTKPSTYGPLYAANAAASMNTLFMEELAKRPENEKIVFAHAFPGIVSTNLNVTNSGFLLQFLWDWILKPVIGFFGTKVDDVGERMLFVATNGRFRRVKDPESARGTLIQEGSNGVLGSGMYMVKEDSSVVEDGGGKALRELREGGGGRRVFDYTMGEMERIESL